MKIKSVTVDPSLVNQTVTDHARRLGMIRSDEVLKLEFFEVEPEGKKTSLTFRKAT